jgi:hypothetical protein
MDAFTANIPSERKETKQDVPKVTEDTRELETSSNGQLFTWIAIAVAASLAGASYYFAGFLTTKTPVTSRTTDLPESYAVCGHSPSQIYTVDDTRSNVDCLIVHKDEIRAVGTHSKFDGDEPHKC